MGEMMSRTIYIALRGFSGSHPKWGVFGMLEKLECTYRFSYTRGAESLEGFQPLPGMHNLE